MCCRIQPQMRRLAWQLPLFHQTLSRPACTVWVEVPPEQALSPPQLRPPYSVVAEAKLLRHYLQLGQAEEARRIFEGMPYRDVVTWTTVISDHTSNGRWCEAMEVFREMLREGTVEPNAYTISSVLAACRGLKQMWLGRAVQGVAIKRDMIGQTYVDNVLLDVYAACDEWGMDDARKLFERMEVKTVVAWTALIAGYTHRGEGEYALRVFTQMLQEGLKLNPFSCSIALRACSSIGSLGYGMQIHGAVVKSIPKQNLPVSNSLLDMYCRCTSTVEAWQHFREMPCKNVITWNTLIGCLARCNPREAIQLSLEMVSHDFRPNAPTFCSILSACAALTALNCGQRVHGAALCRGFTPTVPISNALIDMYAKCGDVQDSHKVFLEMPQKDLISWTSMMNGYGAHGLAKEAIDMFNDMTSLGISIDDVVFVGVLTACSRAGLVDEGLKYFNLMLVNYGIYPTQEMYGCVVDMLGRAGRVEEAYEVVMKMPFEPDESLWSALLAACKMQKDVAIGAVAAEKILSVKPEEATTYVVFSNILASNAHWNEFAKMRKLMRDTGKKKQVGRSWIELRDRVHSFAVDDRCGLQVQLCYNVLETLLEHTSDAGYVPDLPLAYIFQGNLVIG